MGASPTRRLSIRELGVAVLTYGRGNDHLGLLEDLRDSGVPDEHIIVTHNPDRASDDWSPTCPPRATLLQMTRNCGYAAAMNRAIDRFLDRGMSAVLLLTHDGRLDPDSLSALLTTANAAPEYGVLGVAIRGAGHAEVSYGAIIDADGGARHVVERRHQAEILDVDLVDGSIMLVRLAACGASPLPERYFMYFEEAELCASVRERGWRVGTALNATAASASGTKRRRAAFQYLYVRNGLDWSLRHRGRRAAVRFAASQFVRGVLDAPKPGGDRFRDPVSRRAGYAQVAARTLAIIDFVRHRWGPPPPSLLRASDIRNV
jgi:GT2 family glycosyltransferase